MAMCTSLLLVLELAGDDETKMVEGIYTPHARFLLDHTSFFTVRLMDYLVRCENENGKIYRERIVIFTETTHAAQTQLALHHPVRGFRVFFHVFFLGLSPV